jgi:RNA polymerase sigma factor for flagellar operon FliA
MPNTNADLPALMTRTKKLALGMKRRLPAHVDADDLIGVGYLGIAKAMSNWRGGAPAAFEAYAMQCAWGAMLDELRRNDQLTRGERRLAAKLGHAERQLSQALGRQPEPEEVASQLGMSTDDLMSARMRTARRDRVSLSALGSLSPSPSSGPPPDAMLEAVRRAEQLRDALKDLPGRLQTVVDLSCSEELTLREIGARLGVTEARVCQLRKEALTRLRAKCARDSLLPSGNWNAAA